MVLTPLSNSCKLTMMNTPNISILSSLSLFFLLILSCSWSAQSLDHNDFLQCLSLRLKNNTDEITNIVYTPANSSYLWILQSSIRNPRFASPSTPRPQVIVTPVLESQIPAIVLCAKESELQIRTRSGGHDFEGLSYRSEVPFVIIDLFNLNEVTIDVEKKTAWIQAGTTNGQLYYAISRKSNTLGFPSGGCPTVGVGGLLSGGGYGAMLRKYGLAADQVIDARLVDVKGRALDKKSMGKDLFWAIRGGGGASFGVITAWKVNLVPVPDNVTLFTIDYTLEEENATQIFHKWQSVAPTLPKELIIVSSVFPVNSTQTGNKTIQINYNSLYLGPVDKLLQILAKSFPELGVKREDCQEVDWIQSALFFGGYSPNDPQAILTSRNPEIPSSNPATFYYFKSKTDYVQEPIPIDGLEGIWKLLLERDAGMGQLLLVPYGGRMEEISESAIPFPHRAGNLYKFQMLAYWNESGNAAADSSISWARKLHRYLTPYVSKSPRASYLGYRDLDLGVNNVDGKTSYAQASQWGLKYFKNNFKKLVRIKTIVDPDNIFRNEQSIPSMYEKSKKWEKIIQEVLKQDLYPRFME